MSLYMKASCLADALEALSGSERLRIVAGATDVFPAEAARTAWMTGGGERLLDIGSLTELRGVSEARGTRRFGALATWTEIAEADLPAGYDALRTAARQVGGRQIQNRGTIGGNLCNASPAADGVPPLLALDASVELASVQGRRVVKLAEFILGNRRTALRPSELLTAVLVPEPEPDERSVFLKLGARSYLVISIASVAANVRLDASGAIAEARIVVGACSPVPVRLPRIEQAVVGGRPGHAPVMLTPEDGLAPIDDVRASAEYRLQAAGALVRRALAAFADAGSRAA